MCTWIRGKDINPDTTTRLMRLLTALFLAAATIIPGSVTLRASVNRHTGYYVATDGDDASKGTLRRPFRTIARALAEAHAGDTVFVRGGTTASRWSSPRRAAPTPALCSRHTVTKGLS